MENIYYRVLYVLYNVLVRERIEREKRILPLGASVPIPYSRRPSRFLPLGFLRRRQFHVTPLPRAERVSRSLPFSNLSPSPECLLYIQVQYSTVHHILDDAYAKGDNCDASCPTQKESAVPELEMRMRPRGPPLWHQRANRRPAQRLFRAAEGTPRGTEKGLEDH